VTAARVALTTVGAGVIGAALVAGSVAWAAVAIGRDVRCGGFLSSQAGATAVSGLVGTRPQHLDRRDPSFVFWEDSLRFAGCSLPTADD
jgi:hypothetical protein